MSSVSKRINEIKQPRGGYLQRSLFDLYKIDDGFTLNPEENIHATITGMTVDYLTRYTMGAKLSDAFRIPCMGATIAEKMFNQKGSIKKAQELLSGIKVIDAQAIINACKLVTYDVWLRNPLDALTAKRVDEINPNTETIQNIQILVHRSLVFWSKYGPIIKNGFTFEPNGYTKTVTSGDGDYLTSDTLWDFKVSKSKPTSKNTLQLLMYWIMGQHSGQEIFNNIHNLGIFNPRLNEIYLLSTDSIPKDIIAKVEQDVICY